MIRRINLIPPSERLRTQTDFGMLGLVVLAVVVVAGIALSYVFFNGTLTDRKRELEQVQAQTAQVRSQLAALAQYETLGNQRRDAEEVIQHIYAGRTLLSQTLGDLSLVIPKEVWLQQLSLTSPPVPLFEGGTPATAPSKTAEVDQGSFTIAGTTYTFDDVATLLVRLEQMPSLTVPCIEPLGVGALHPLHSHHQIRFRRFQQEMIMVPQQRVRMHPPSRALADFAQRCQEHRAVSIPPEYLLQTVSPAHYVVDRPRIFHSGFSWHAPFTSFLPVPRQFILLIYRTDPFGGMDGGRKLR